MPSKQFQDCFFTAKQSLNQGSEPTLCGEGTSGSYFIKTEDGENVAIFKPIDEEPFAPNNPRGMKGAFGSATCRESLRSGELTVREVTAYMLDHEGFANVPPTGLVEMCHE